MFDINENKVFMDSVHGYISIPRCFVDNLIDTEYFQRLRNIDQTGMRILYPDGKHDRFCHSLGVYYLGRRGVDALLNNFSLDKYWKIRSDRDSIIFWAKNKVLFLIACLLHDIGHAPFSHSLEKEILYNSGGNSFKQKLAEHINKLEREVNHTQSYKTLSAMEISSAPHEQIGAMIIIEKLKDNISRIFDKLIEDGYPNIEDNSILFAEYYNYRPIINKKEFDDDIAFIVRMILGLKYNEYTPERQIRNCFIELLNGSNIDVDKLDYTIRDTKMSGISNITIDVERILKSITIITKTCFQKYCFTKNNSFANHTIHKINNKDNVGKIEIDGILKGEFVLLPNTKIKIYVGSEISSFKGEDGEAKIEYISSQVNFSVSSIISRNGTEIHKRKNGDYKTLTEEANDLSFNCTIIGATVLDPNDFHVKVCDRSVLLSINGKCHIEIEGYFYTNSSIRLFDDTSLSGNNLNLDMLGNHIANEIPNDSKYNTFSIGFTKQAINKIASVLEARDYLYLWCYAHHKIIYYANFLVPAISNSILENDQICNSSSFPSWKLHYDNIRSLDDAYIWTVIRSTREKVDADSKKLCDEVLSRKYKISMWKSLAEFDLIFEEFNEDEKINIKNNLSKAICSKKPHVKDDNIIVAGFLDEEVVNKIKQFNTVLNDLKNIVFIPAGYNHKYTDIYNTFILMNNEVIPLDRISLLSEKVTVSQRNMSQYFYLYYDTVSSQELNPSSKKILIERTITFFKTYLI